MDYYLRWAAFAHLFPFRLVSNEFPGHSLGVGDTNQPRVSCKYTKSEFKNENGIIRNRRRKREKTGSKFKAKD
jgi:hypothetical protein